MVAALVRRSSSAILTASLVRRLAPVAESAQQARQELRWMGQELERRRLEPLKPTSPASATLSVDLEGMVKRREAGEPLQYVLGNQPFGPLLLNVRPPTLIPRPETEEWACRLASLLAPAQPLRILDLCTGSGCVPLLLLHSLPKARAHGVDLAASALTLARENAALHDLESRFDAVEQDLFADGFAQRWVEAHGRADLVTSNPPYIPISEMRTLDPGVRDWEDGRALLGDMSLPSSVSSAIYPPNLAHLSRDRGLDFYALIASILPTLLGPRTEPDLPSGCGAPRLVLEVGHDQAREVKQLLLASSSSDVLDRVDIWEDAMGRERVVVGF